MAGLLWFRAFKRDSLEERARVLMSGESPPPRGVAQDTEQLELDLEMGDRCVYFYAGRTKEIFGDVAVVLEEVPEEQGTISPFDTGGLVRKIVPVSSWTPSRRNQFLNEFSWSVAEFPERVAEYPGTDLARYLDPSAFPEREGPHEYWRGQEAPIWRAPNEWRAWTWEARLSSHVPTLSALTAWSCSPAIADELLDLLDTEAPDDAERLQDRYIPGGVGELVRIMQERQVTP